jgi:hypothetical protein
MQFYKFSFGISKILLSFLTIKRNKNSKKLSKTRVTQRFDINIVKIKQKMYAAISDRQQSEQDLYFIFLIKYNIFTYIWRLYELILSRVLTLQNTLSFLWQY